MKKSYIIAGIVVLLVSAGVIGYFVSDDGTAGGTPAGSSETGLKAGKGGSADAGSAADAGGGGASRRPKVTSPKARTGAKLAFGQWRDEFGEKEGEIRELCQKIVDELQDALDNNDRTKVLLIIAKFRAPMNQGGLDGYVSKELRGKAIEALGWFGSASVTDLFEFMADQDEEVAEDAFTKFEQALDDWDMGDRERSKVLQEVARMLSDSERIDSLLFNLNNMRNSVKADTIASIIKDGTPEAQALMKDQVEFYLDMDVEATEEGIAKWKAENPDDATDEEFFGPQKNDN